MQIKIGSVVWTNYPLSSSKRLCGIGVVVKCDDQLHVRMFGFVVSTAISSMSKEFVSGYYKLKPESLEDGTVLVFLDFWSVMNILRRAKEGTKLDD
jgi:hypothetical protein